MIGTDHYISVAKDFTLTPGARYKAEGPYPGEEFLSGILRPAFIRAQIDRVPLVVNLDGVAGYASSFLEQAFGGLAREFPVNDVLSVLQFQSNDEPLLIEEIKEYIRDARAPRT